MILNLLQMEYGESYSSSRGGPNFVGIKFCQEWYGFFLQN